MYMPYTLESVMSLSTSEAAGIPIQNMPIDFDRQQFFWSRVRKEGDHLIWEGAETTRGYGKIEIGGRSEYAHRVSYCIANNLDIKDIDNLKIVKLCPVNECVAPAHLAPKEK
jgi:hypothetical protein